MMVFTSLLFTILIGTSSIQPIIKEQASHIESIQASSKEKCRFNNGKISIVFPGEFEITTANKEYGTTKKAMHKDADGTLYYIAWTRHNESLDDTDALNETSLNSFTETTGSELMSSSSIKYKKHKGLKGIIKFKEGQIVYRVLIIGHNQFQIVVASQSKDVTKEATKFYKSFKYKA